MTRHPFDLDPDDPRVELLAALYRERYTPTPRRQAGGDDQGAGDARRAVLAEELTAYEETCQTPRRGRHGGHLRVAS